MSILNIIKKPLGLIKDTIIGLPQATKELVTGTGEFSADKTLGIARNTVLGLPKATKDTLFPTRGYTEEQLTEAKPSILDIVKAPIKIGAEIATSFGDITNIVAQKPLYKATQTNIGSKLADIGQNIKDFSIPKTPEEAKAMRGIDILSSIPTGIGSVKNIGTASKIIANTDDIARITKELKGIGLADDIIKDLAPKLRTINNDKIVADLISGSKVEDISNSLIQEAKKYKSAEEFVKARIEYRPSQLQKFPEDEYWSQETVNKFINDNPGTIYHGSTEDAISGIRQTGVRSDNKKIYFASNPQIAESYGINKVHLYPDELNILDVSSPKGISLLKKAGIDPNIPNLNDSLQLLLEKEGFDGIKYRTSKSNFDYEILNNDKVNTLLKNQSKSQLTDIWNKAHNIKIGSQNPTSNLLQEAKKYKTAEEFVKAQKLGKTKETIQKAIVQDVTDTQIKVNNQWYSKKLFDENYKIGDSVPKLEIKSIKRIENPDYEISSDLFRSASGANQKDIVKVSKYSSDMKKYGGWGDFPPVVGDKEVITRQDYLDYKKFGNEAQYSRPLKESDIGKEIVVIENGNHRAFAAQKNGYNIQVIDSNLQEKSKSQLIDIWNKANLVDNFGVGNPSDILGSRSYKNAKKGFDAYFDANYSKPAKTIDEVDRLIAQGKIRLKRINDRDVFQYEKGGKWVNARDSDSAVAQVNKKLFPIKKEIKAPTLPPQLEQKAMSLEFKKEVLDNSPFAGDNKFMVDREGRIRELGDVRSPKLVRNIEDRMMSANVEDPQEFSAGVEKYLKDRAELKIEQKKLNLEIQQYKEELKSKTVAKQKDLVQVQGDLQVVSKSPITEGEARSLQKVAEQSAKKSSEEYDLEFEPLQKIISQYQTPVNKKIGLLDYVRTPDRVLEKIGLGDEMRFLRSQYDKYLKELPENIQKITDWSVQVSEESNKRIFRYLDGEALDLNPIEKKIAMEIKDWLKQWAEKLGLPEDNRIAEYITHIFDRELLAKEFDEDLAKIIRDKLPSEVYNPFLEKRLGAKGYIQDTWKALDAYVKRATRKVNVDPALEKIADKSASFEESQWNYVKKFLDNVNMRPTTTDNLLDNSFKQMFGYYLGQRPTNVITKTLRQMTYRGMLGGNLSSALRNLSQGINTYAKLGEKYTALGYLELFKTGAEKEMIEQGILNNNFIQDRTLTAGKKLLQKFDDALFFFFDKAEKINRGSAYFGAKAKGISKGMSEKEAVEYAKKIVRDTQFAFTSIDTPVLFQSDLVKTLLQFQTYSTKQIEFLVEMAKNKEFAGLLRYALAGALFTYTIGQAFGMDLKDIVPTLRFDTPASLKLPKEIIGAVMDIPDKYGKERDFGKKISDITKALIGYIPAGIQAKKTYEGLKSVIEGASIDKGGKTQFKVGGTLPKNAQAILFGKYASEEAKNYFNGKSEAEVVYEKIIKSNNPKELFDVILKSDPSLAKKVLEVKKKKDLGITEKEEKILRMGVENKQRANKVYEELNKLKTEDEKSKLWNDYVNKKIITKEVAKQLKELLNTPKKEKTNILNTIFGIKTTEASEISQIDKLQITPKRISKLNFSEKYIPTATIDGKNIPIDKIDMVLPEKSTIKKIIITKSDGKKEEITNERQLIIASKIKAISDRINPKYTNYLIKTAFNESSLGTSTTNVNKNYSTDNGVFQINDKSFPQINKELANDLGFATLWAISLIEAGKQKRWSSNSKSRSSKIEIIN